MTKIWFGKDGAKVPIDVSVDGYTRLLTNPAHLHAFGDAIQGLIRGPIPFPAATETMRWRLRLRQKVKSGEAMEEEDKRWLLRYLDSPMSVLRKPNGRPAAQNDYLVLLLVTLTAKAGLKPFKNPLSNNDCGCEMVAEAFRRAGFTPNSYSGVKAAYLRGRRAWGRK